MSENEPGVIWNPNSKEVNKTVDETIVRIIKDVKENSRGTISPKFVRKYFSHSVVPDIMETDLAISKMRVYGLITEHYLHKNMYMLTEKGWQFNSFEDEKKKEDLKNALLNINVKNAKNIQRTYWISFVISLVSFAISIYLLLKGRSK